MHALYGYGVASPVSEPQERGRAQIGRRAHTPHVRLAVFPALLCMLCEYRAMGSPPSVLLPFTGALVSRRQPATPT
jgi:hypothetical protein